MEESLEQRLARLESRVDDLERGARPALLRPAGAPRPALKPAEPIDWERLAGVWFNRVGVAALVFGAAFFLKYAFDHRWIGELGRVVAGLLAGTGMVVAGDRLWRRDMAQYGQMLIGGGVSILYLSIYAAFGYYRLIGQAPAFAFMSAVTALAWLLAVRRDAYPVALVGVLGGFLTPWLMSTGEPRFHILFGYLLIMDAGVAAIALFKDWRGLSLLALSGTQLYAQGYGARWYHPEQLAPYSLYIGLYWLLFVGASVGRTLRSGLAAKPHDLALAALNAAAYFGALYWKLRPEFQPWLGLFAAATAGGYAALGAGLKSRQGADGQLVLLHLGLAVVFLTIAIPIQLDLRWVTVGWAAEAAMLFAAGFKLGQREARLMGAAVLLVAVLRALFADTWLPGAHAFLLNQRGLAYGGVLGAIGVCVSGYAGLAEPHEQERPFRNAFGIAGVFLGLWLLSWEGAEFWRQLSPERQLAWFGEGWEAARYRRIAESFSLSAAWTLYGFAWFVYGVRTDRRPIRLLALAILGLAIVKVFLVDLSFLRTVWRILSLLGLGAVTLAVSYHYQREQRPAAANP
ncbi:MAG: DUF2339 domain-containing protein [Elusimicrobia bacterium]|nr:DUF2339 domain-containing protein [Elusimicrobiota bacterium]